MVQNSGGHQLRLVVFPVFYKVCFPSLVVGLGISEPSTVVPCLGWCHGGGRLEDFRSLPLELSAAESTVLLGTHQSSYGCGRRVGPPQFATKNKTGDGLMVFFWWLKMRIFLEYLLISFWANYSDLTRPHSKWWFSKGNPLISGKPRLVKYYNLARIAVAHDIIKHLRSLKWRNPKSYTSCSGYRLCSNKTPPNKNCLLRCSLPLRYLKFLVMICCFWKVRILPAAIFECLQGRYPRWVSFDIRVVSSLGIFGFLWVLFIIIIIFDFLISLVSFSYLFWSGGDFFNSKSAVTTAVWPPVDGREFFVSQNLWVIVRGPP